MPRTKLDKQPDKLFVLLNGTASGKTSAELCEIIGKREKTTRERMRDPDKLTLAELKRLGRNLHIPIEELRNAITY